ncbi:thioesterase family protein [Glutamicibacter sp. PS]|uniref:thioesterase family protein n=1 Tax=Glutamicibacter sp. PS TaxID=3075634 RepID=UPI002850AC42|nr:thioesterase family protein [Glutamicibacter sp. PS]MDR4533129.1 thioesterase family protein [Glutamicibacter sp. PS]
MNLASESVFSDYATVVDESWIDYNGHMSEAYYVLVFGFATDAAMDRLGLDADYRQRTRCSLYTVEAHVRYLAEVSLGQSLTVRTVLTGHGEKKVHLAHEMYRGEELVATEEILGLHVEQQSGRSVALPDAAQDAARRAAADPPSWCGRRVG